MFFGFGVVLWVSGDFCLSLVNSLVGRDDFFGGITAGGLCNLYNMRRIDSLTPVVVQQYRSYS